MEIIFIYLMYEHIIGQNNDLRTSCYCILIHNIALQPLVAVNRGKHAHVDNKWREKKREDFCNQNRETCTANVIESYNNIC